MHHNSASVESHGTYVLAVDYDLLIEEAIEHGRYDRYNWAREYIIKKACPTNRKGLKTVLSALIRFNQSMTTEDILHKLEQMNYRPAELQELLAFGEHYPNIQLQFPIIALGSQLDQKFFPCLDFFMSGRELKLYYCRYQWDSIFRFLTVIKEI